MNLVSKEEKRLSIPQKFRQSAKDFKKVQTLTGVAMLIAMSVVISFVGSVRVTDTLRISFGYLITALLGMIYGPFTGMVAAGVADLVKYLLKPDGQLFLGFTLTAMLGGVIYGCLFYKEKCTVWRAIIAKSMVSIFLNIFLNTYWLSILYGSPFLGLMIPRVAKNLMLLPFEIVLLYIVLNGMTRVLNRARLG